MGKTTKFEAKNPLILRFYRLMDAFAKSDDERDFYLDRLEGFILFVDLDKTQKELDDLEKEFQKDPSRFFLVPKITFYESKKLMEGFVNEKVYDVDTKEKLLEIIQSKDAKENFLEFIYDHLLELEKWQQFYVERSRIRIIEWLRSYELSFVFEEDIDLAKILVEEIKHHLFDQKVAKRISEARSQLQIKAKTYYSSEALNPRPKRGRPPKQSSKVMIEPQVTADIYSTVPSVARPFLYVPEIASASRVAFGGREDAELMARFKGSSRIKVDERLEALSERLEALRHISSRLSGLKGLGGEGDEKLIRTAELSIPKGEEEDKGILSVVKGFLPKKKQAESKKVKERVQKTVTPIKKRSSS